MKVTDYARAVKRVEQDFEEDWTVIANLCQVGASEGAITDVLRALLRARRKAVWGIACLFLQSVASRKGCTSPMPQFGDLKRATVAKWVRQATVGGEITPQKLRGLKQACVSSIRDEGRGTIAAAASTKFADYPDLRETKPEPDDDMVEVVKDKDSDYEATADDIDEIFSRYWAAEMEAAKYVNEGDAPGLDLDKPVRKPVGWARMIQGAETCGFCIVMAARAYDYILYKSEQTALRKDKGGYHRNCDCIAVPVFDVRNWEGKAQGQKAREWYDAHNDADESWRKTRGTL